MSLNKYFFLSFCALLLFINADCKKNPITPIDDLKPGRRDYIWTIDTLKLSEVDLFTPTRIWGSAPNDVWIAGSGDVSWNLLWHFDGVSWKKDSLSRAISPSALWGTAGNNIWLGNYSHNSFWRYDGTQWYKFCDITVPSGYDRVVISSIWGTSASDIWAVGFADQFNGGTQYKGIIMHFNGSQWQFVGMPNIKCGFNEVYQDMQTGLIYIGGGGYETNGYTYKIILYDYKNFSEINSNYESGSHVYLVKNKVYFVIAKKIYDYLNKQLQLWKDFSNTNFVGVMYGRTEKDFFTYTSNDFVTWGIGHYNGSDLETIYWFPANFRISGAVIFEEEIFFQGYSLNSNVSIVIHGVLKNNTGE
jgi:hypothetical protein